MHHSTDVHVHKLSLYRRGIKITRFVEVYTDIAFEIFFLQYKKEQKKKFRRYNGQWKKDKAEN